MDAIDKDKYAGMEDFDLVDELNRISGVEVPYAVESIRNADVIHKTICAVSDMQKVVEDKLGLAE